VAILFKEQTTRGIQLQFDFKPVPTLMCRPQLLSVVFSNLLSNAINAANGEGRIVVSTRLAAEGSRSPWSTTSAACQRTR
jgi:signal transduction histidine kinase